MGLRRIFKKACSQIKERCWLWLTSQFFVLPSKDFVTSHALPGWTPTHPRVVSGVRTHKKAIIQCPNIFVCLPVLDSYPQVDQTTTPACMDPSGGWCLKGLSRSDGGCLEVSLSRWVPGVCQRVLKTLGWKCHEGSVVLVLFGSFVFLLICC